MKRRSSRKQPAKLSYGNQDLSKWDGKETSSDLSGFWLESSLKITPVEQVQVLDKIFEQSEVFSHFATHLSDPECEQISGLLAKQITKNVIVQYW